MKTPNDTETQSDPTTSGAELDCPAPAGYAPFVPPFHYRPEMSYIADSRGAIMADLRMWPALTGYKVKDQDRIGNWIAESLSDCAFAERDGDNLQHNNKE